MVGVSFYEIVFVFTFLFCLYYKKIINMIENMMYIMKVRSFRQLQFYLNFFDLFLDSEQAVLRYYLPE